MSHIGLEMSHQVRVCPYMSSSTFWAMSNSGLRLLFSFFSRISLGSERSSADCCCAPVTLGQLQSLCVLRQSQPS